MAAADPEQPGAGTSATTAASTAVNVPSEEDDLTSIGPQDEAQRAQVRNLMIKSRHYVFIQNTSISNYMFPKMSLS